MNALCTIVDSAWLTLLGDVPGGGELWPAVVINCARALPATTTAFSTAQKPAETVVSFCWALNRGTS